MHFFTIVHLEYISECCGGKVSERQTERRKTGGVCVAAAEETSPARHSFFSLSFFLSSFLSFFA